MMNIILAGSDKNENKEFINKQIVDIVSKIQYDLEVPCSQLKILSKGSGRGTDWHIKKLAKKYNIQVIDFKSNWNDLNEQPCFPKSSFYGMINSLAGYNANDRIINSVKNKDTVAILFDDEDVGIKDLIKKCKKFGIKTWQIKCKDMNDIKVKVWNGE